MMYNPSAGGPFRHSILTADPAAAREEETRRSERERADRLADELTRSFAGYGSLPVHVELLDLISASRAPVPDRPAASPLAWIKRFFH